jgi:hypothetical protein
MCREDVAYAHDLVFGNRRQNLDQKSCEFLSGNWVRFNQRPIPGPIYCEPFFVRFRGLVFVAGEDLRAARLLDGLDGGIWLRH